MARKNQYPAKVFTETHASCGKCQSMKLFSEFHKSKADPHGLAYWCKVCAGKNGSMHHRRRVKEDPNYQRAMRERWVKKAHGISLYDYLEKLKSQDCKCEICNCELPTEGPLTHLDHDHVSGQIRSFLCTNCNRGLGHFKDNSMFLSQAIKYLEKWKC